MTSPPRRGGNRLGQSDFAPITLSKGLAIGDSAMMDWMSSLFTVMQGMGSGKPGADFRQTITVDVLDHPYTSQTKPVTRARFKIYNAWPTAVAFSDLDAGANAIIVSQMTLAHEGFEFSIAKKVTDPSL